MSLLDNLGGLLQGALSGNASESDVHAAYDKVTQAAPSGDLAGALAHVFNSDQTPPFEQMLGGLFNQSNGDQKASILNRLIAAAGPAVLSSIAGGSLANMVGGGVTPEQAEQVSPDTVQVLAQHAAQNDPSIVDQTAGVYAQHPSLLKSLGAGALSMLMARLSKGNA